MQHFLDTWIHAWETWYNCTVCMGGYRYLCCDLKQPPNSPMVISAMSWHDFGSFDEKSQHRRLENEIDTVLKSECWSRDLLQHLAGCTDEINKQTLKMLQYWLLAQAMKLLCTQLVYMQKILFLNRISESVGLFFCLFRVTWLVFTGSYLLYCALVRDSLRTNKLSSDPNYRLQNFHSIYLIVCCR